MDMAEHGIFLFVHLYDAVEKVFDTETGFADGRDNRRTDHPRERVVVELVAVPFQFVVHIEGDNHTYVHVDQLAGQVEVAFQVGCVDHVDHDVRLFFIEMLADVEFFRGVGR